MIHLILLTVPILSTFTFAHADPNHFATHIGIGGHNEWSYGSGVTSWAKSYPGCAGHSQSPIALEDDKANKVPMGGLTWGNMDTIPVYMDLFKTKHSVMLSGVWHSNEVPFIKITSTREKFILDEVHWHWGNEDNDGTEHEVEGHKGALEMHMVFGKANGQGNSSKLVYGHLFKHNESSVVPDGIKAVANNLETASFKPWQKYQKARLPSVFTAGDLFHPQPTKVFFYSGSLTTPPCTEPVLWLVGAEMGSVSNDEMNAFRHMKDKEGRKMAGNVRPVQPRNKRKYKSFTVMED